MLSEATDQHLLQLSLADDDAAFSHLVSRWSPVVRARCARQLQGADVDDAEQAVFLILHRRLAQAARHPSLPAWLLVVCQNVVRNAKRDRRRRLQRFGSTPQDVRAHQPGVGADWQACLDEALAALPGSERQAVERFYLVGESQTSIASSLGCPPATVATRVHRGLQRLRRNFARRGFAVSATLLGIWLADLRAAYQHHWQHESRPQTPDATPGNASQLAIQWSLQVHRMDIFKSYCAPLLASLVLVPVLGFGLGHAADAADIGQPNGDKDASIQQSAVAQAPVKDGLRFSEQTVATFLQWKQPAKFTEAFLALPAADLLSVDGQLLVQELAAGITDFRFAAVPDQGVMDASPAGERYRAFQQLNGMVQEHEWNMQALQELQGPDIKKWTKEQQASYQDGYANAQKNYDDALAKLKATYPEMIGKVSAQYGMQLDVRGPGSARFIMPWERFMRRFTKGRKDLVSSNKAEQVTWSLGHMDWSEHWPAELDAKAGVLRIVAQPLSLRREFAPTFLATLGIGSNGLEFRSRLINAEIADIFGEQGKVDAFTPEDFAALPGDTVAAASVNLVSVIGFLSKKLDAKKIEKLQQEHVRRVIMYLSDGGPLPQLTVVAELGDDMAQAVIKALRQKFGMQSDGIRQWKVNLAGFGSLRLRHRGQQVLLTTHRNGFAHHDQSDAGFTKHKDVADAVSQLEQAPHVVTAVARSKALAGLVSNWMLLIPNLNPDLAKGFLRLPQKDFPGCFMLQSKHYADGFSLDASGLVLDALLAVGIQEAESAANLASYMLQAIQ